MENNFRIFALKEELETRIFYALCAGVAFTIPFKSSWNSSLSIALFAFWIVFLNKRFEFRSLKFKLVLLLSGVFFLTLIGLIYTSNLPDGVFRVQQKVVLLIFPLIFGTIEVDFKKLSLVIMNSFIAGLSIACILTLVNAIRIFIEHKTTNQFFGHDLAQWINLYPYVFSLFCLLAILFLLERFRYNTQNKTKFNQKYLALGSILFFTMFILLLSVKLILISWLIVSLVYSFLLIQSKWRLMVIYSSLFIITVASMLFIPTLKQKAIELISSNDEGIVLDEDSSLGKSWSGIALRKAIWSCSLGVIEKNIWVGVGSGDGQDELQAAYESRKFYFASRYNKFNSHNEYLQILVNFGLMGLSVFLMSLFLPLYLLRSNIVFVMLTFCFASIFFTESMFEVNKGVVIYALFNSLFVMWKLEERKK